MKVHAKQFTIRKLCEISKTTPDVLYREIRNLLKNPDLIEIVFNNNGGENAKRRLH